MISDGSDQSPHSINEEVFGQPPCRPGVRMKITRVEQAGRKGAGQRNKSPDEGVGAASLFLHHPGGGRVHPKAWSSAGTQRVPKECSLTD